MVPNATLLPKAGHRNQSFSPSKWVIETLIFLSTSELLIVND